MAGLLQTQIVLAADAVAYLPFFVANDLKPQIKVSGGLLSWDEAFLRYTTEPQNTLSTLPPAESRTGDVGCLNAVINAWETDKRAWIAICDPCEIPMLRDSSKLVVVGGLIKRACFWCVADDHVGGASDPRQLAIQNLAIHEPGLATGYQIGHYVAKLRAPIKPLVYTGPFGLVVDGAAWLSSEEGQMTGVAAVTASVLSAALAEQEKLFRIRFALHEMEEFTDFLTTGFVVHKEALKDDLFRDHLRLLLYGTILASKMLKQSPASAMEYIRRFCRRNDRFVEERLLDSAKVEGSRIVPKTIKPSKPTAVKESTVRRVHELLFDSDLYSCDGEITDSQWQSACFGDRKVQGDWPPLLDFYRPAVLFEAQREFNRQMTTGVTSQDIDEIRTRLDGLGGSVTTELAELRTEVAEASVVGTRTDSIVRSLRRSQTYIIAIALLYALMENTTVINLRITWFLQIIRSLPGGAVLVFALDTTNIALFLVTCMIIVSEHRVIQGVSRPEFLVRPIRSAGKIAKEYPFILVLMSVVFLTIAVEQRENYAEVTKSVWNSVVK